MENKKIYIVATPIGNLKDITLRALETLQSVDFIAAEDTRTTQKLLNHYNIKKRMVAYHKFNEQHAAQKIIDLVKQGSDIALVSDAGMPLIADPGYFLIQMAREENIEVEIIPGASAFVASFALSGFSAPFTFLGFLKDKSTQRLSQISQLISGVYVVYVAPHKLIGTLEDIAKAFPENNRIFLSKEITKKFEKHFYGTATELLQQLPEAIKGEYTLCLEISAFKEAKIKINKYAKFSKIDN